VELPPLRGETFAPVLRHYLRATGVREFAESWIGVAGNRLP
jgi:hypothetical protein